MIAAVLALAIIIGDRPIPKTTAAAQVAIAADLKAYPDTTAIAAHPGLARRTGRVLRIGQFSFVDEGECDGSGCTRYRFDAVWPGNIVGVTYGEDENSDYYLLSGVPTPVGARPVPSPGGRYFFVGFLNENTGSSATGLDSSIAIWQFDMPNVGLARTRVVDVPIVAFSKFIAWHGDSCAEFSGFQHYEIAGPERRFWLVQEPLDWVLHDTRPTACP